MQVKEALLFRTNKKMHSKTVQIVTILKLDRFIWDAKFGQWIIVYTFKRKLTTEKLTKPNLYANYFFTRYN